VTEADLCIDSFELLPKPEYLPPCDGGRSLKPKTIQFETENN
jgi:hypothetical protein